jgi:hypothetical protein
MSELNDNGVPSLTDDGIIYSRRMARDEAQRAGATMRQRQHRASANYTKPKGNGSSQESHASVTPVSQRSSSSSSSSSSEIQEREHARASRFSLKECEEYASSRKGLKSVRAFAKTIWRSGEDDEQIAAFQAGHSGNPVKKPPDEPPDPAELKRLADDLDAMKHHEDAKALRASVKLE